MALWCAAVWCCLATWGAAPATDNFAKEDLAFFQEKIRPLLSGHCFECHSHSAKKLKGGLFLDNRSGVLQGGDSGPAIVPGQPEQSRLVEAVRYQNPDLRMPPKTKLEDFEIALLEDWVKRGVPWPEESLVANAPAAAKKAFNLAERRKEHWAWQAVKDSTPPAVMSIGWPSNPVDNFVLAKLEENHLQPTPEADRRVLIRRLSFMLTGLPPTPEDVTAFVHDTSTGAYGKLVDRLLASPQFGERWARHWLDVVRYAETLGHEFDYPLPNAWRYRDYVIRAFNADVPYDEFVREHVAGDLMEEPRRDPATGWDESATAPAFYWFGQQVHSPVDIKANQLDVIDNQIDTMMRGFQALTVSCARCHDHKFDAISTKDFYALYGVLESSRYVQKDISDEASNRYPLEQLSKLRRELEEELEASASREPNSENTKDHGSAAPFHRPGRVDLRLGLDARQRVPTAFRAPDKRPQLEVAVSYEKAGSFDNWFPEGSIKRDGKVHSGDLLYAGPTNSIVRVASSFGPILSSRKLSPWLTGGVRSPNFVITNRYLHVLAAGQGSRAKVIIENFALIQAPIYGDLRKVIGNDTPNWLTFDLRMWQGRNAYLEVMDDMVPDLAGPGTSGLRADGWFDLIDVATSDDATPPPNISYEEVAVAAPTIETLKKMERVGKALPHATYAPTMADSEGMDEHVFIRGGARHPGELVGRRYLEALGGLERPVNSGSGRLVVAATIASANNPLTARVWVNRVWHHLFGRGIVATVDDFGVLGQRPSHPELLDWLANWFVAEGEWSTKKLIRLLVTSSAWRQSAMAADDPGASGPAGASEFDRLDPENIFLHKWTVRRLEGEAIRDAMLAISGRLDLEPFGPSVPVYLTDFMTGRGRPGKSGPMDGEGRRSVYLEVRRNFMPPMMLAFDTPQAAQTFGRRAESNVPAQALILLNDPFVHEQARLWAERMIASTDTDMNQRILWLYLQAYQRKPKTEELAVARRFLIEQSRLSDTSAEEITVAAWADLCHVLFNTKEFVFVN